MLVAFDLSITTVGRKLTPTLYRSRGNMTGQAAACARKEEYTPSTRSPGPVDVSGEGAAFIASMKHCAQRLLLDAMPPVSKELVPGLGAVYVAHAARLRGRWRKLSGDLRAHSLSAPSVLAAFDGDSLSPAARSCFFPNPPIIGGDNRLSLVLKHHLAYFAIVKLGLGNALVVEDDLDIPPGVNLKVALEPNVHEMSQQGCDILTLAPFSVGYLISNHGARKMLSALFEGAEGILNPSDWQMDYISDMVTNFKFCKGRQLFDHYGHCSDQGKGNQPHEEYVFTQ